MRKEKGITLIALVITIIVLLILAGVSISLVVGQNGVLNKAQGAVVENKKGTAKEQVGMAWSSAQTDYIADSVTKGAVATDYFTKEKLNSYLSQGEVTKVSYGVNANGDSEVSYKLEDTYYKMIISNDGVRIDGEPVATEPTIQDPVVPPTPPTPSGGSASTMVASDIGKTVTGYKDYTRSSGATSNEWQIMYTDSNNIYLISKYIVNNPTDSTKTLNPPVTGSVKDNYSTGATLFDSYPAVQSNWLAKWTNRDNTANNMKATAYMLDSEGVWNSVYGVTGKSKWVIGGPTMEMLCKAYDKYGNGTAETKYNAISVDGVGYNNPLSASDSLPTTTGWWNNSEYYWLACPSDDYGDYVRYVNYSGACVDSYTYSGNIGFRPVVCLDSSVTLTASADGNSYTIN